MELVYYRISICYYLEADFVAMVTLFNDIVVQFNVSVSDKQMHTF